MNVTRLRVERRNNQDNHSFEKAFKKAVDQAGIIREYKERQYYEKPSEKKRRKLRQRAYQRELEKREQSGRGRRRDYEDQE